MKINEQRVCTDRKMAAVRTKVVSRTMRLRSVLVPILYFQARHSWAVPSLQITPWSLLQIECWILSSRQFDAITRYQSDEMSCEISSSTISNTLSNFSDKQYNNVERNTGKNEHLTSHFYPFKLKQVITYLMNIGINYIVFANVRAFSLY